MEKQPVYSSAKMLGPFWTLILKITSGKTSQTARALPCESNRTSAGCSASAEFDETRDFQAVSGPVCEIGGTSQAYTFPSYPMPGPFLELILTLHRSHSKRDAMSLAAPRRVMVTG
jgi:hypothetical protein